MLTRRLLLRGSIAAAGLAVMNRAAALPAGPGIDLAAIQHLATAPTAGELIGTLPFVGEGPAPLDTPTGAGLDGRLYSDISVLTPASTGMPNERFYIRTRYPDRLGQRPDWSIAVTGQVRRPRTITANDLAGMATAMGTHVMECAGNGAFAHFGMLSAAVWHGVPVARVLQTLEPLAAGRRVLVSGFDGHSASSNNSQAGASWIFTPDDLARSGAFFATRMNGVALPPDHGFPVRLVVPGWYGCASMKWVDGIELVADAAPATPQMKEFASRTHQTGVPDLARDFSPAIMDVAAMPIRVEKRKLNGRMELQIVGLMWGGTRFPESLLIEISRQEPVRVEIPAAPAGSPWRVWSCPWKPASRGRYNIAARIDERNITAKRLEMGFYTRTVELEF